MRNVQEAENYNFHLDNSYNAAGDLNSSYNAYREGQPLTWQKFLIQYFQKGKIMAGYKENVTQYFK